MTGRKTIRITSDTVDAAVHRAETMLKLSRNEFETKVIQKESKGLIGRKKAVVEFSFDPEEQELREREYEIEKCIDLKIMSKGIYLKVDEIPEELAPRAFYLIRKYIQRRNIFEVDSILLKKIIELKCGKHVLIQKTDIHTIGNARISVFTTSDMMRATLIRFDLEPLDKEELRRYLEKRSIKFGINKQILDNPGDEKLLNRPVIIAEGTMPVTEVKAPLKYNFDPDILSIRFDDKDNVDFKNMSELSAVKKGQTLAEKGETVPGQSGIKINGEEIPFDIEHDGPIPHGKGVCISPDGKSLRAAIDGHLVFDYGIISVEPVYIVQGDVDYHTGNIEFDGGVIVCGDVLSGFKVTATGKVEVHGVIDGGVVETEGSLVVKQGIFSKEHGYVKVGGTVVAKHIEGMKIEANRIQVHSNIINADVKAIDYIEVFGDPGTIIGGTTRAGNYVKANTIGSPMGNKTCITVGSPDDVLESIPELVGSIRNRKEELQKVQSGKALVEERPDPSGKTAVNSETLVKLKSTESQVLQELEQLEEKMSGLQKSEKRLRVAKVHFRDHIYEGVNVRIFTSQMTVKKAKEHGSIVWENEEVKIIHYHYREGL